MYLHSFLDYWARERPDCEFAVQGDHRLTYGEALVAVNKLAYAFVSSGLKQGDRIALLARNSIEYPLLYYAASKSGIVPVPLNYRLAPPEWTYLVNDARARMLIVSGHYVEAVDALRGELKTVERFISLDATGAPGWEDYQGWVSAHPSIAPAILIGEDAELYQMYTSGTTGHPKGAILTHRAVTANIGQISVAVRGQPGERYLVVVPMFHAGAILTVFTPVSWGSSLYIHEEFNPAEVVRALSEERIAFTALVPAMLQACLMRVPDIASRHYEHLRIIYYGASPISEETLRRAMEVFRCGFVQSYGQTEAAQTVTLLLPSDHQRALSKHPELLLSAGRPAVGTEVRIVDENDNPVPNGTVGEIVVRGPQIMRGYWNLPKESAATLRNGWLHTGDLGTLDEEGYLLIQDRVKDMIVSGGENVYPSIVENVLYQHPAIAEATVIGVPDERWGETVKAIVVLRQGATATEEEIIEFCRRKLGGFERPRSVEFVDFLPRNPTGKVLKRVLREPYWVGRSRWVSGV
jgi:acyl-CoA synthetase (AMP-forming)/AMP-acid ligase II